MEETMNFFKEKGRWKEITKVVDEEDEVVLPGFRFHPTDEELVGFYLRRMVEKKKPPSIDIIKQMDIYKYDPWDLLKLSTNSENECYFFCLRGRKYRNSIRPNRVTGSGFWKATGIDRPIYSNKSSNDCIGLKKSLVYYSGSAGKGTKTDWMMHEFRLPTCAKTYPPCISEPESWTICRIFKRKLSSKQLSWKEGGGHGRQNPADLSSKTGSLESIDGDGERCFHGESNLQDVESYMNWYQEEKVQSDSSGQLSAAANTVSLESTFVNLNENEILREGNWDEIGKTLDFMLEPATSTYDCIFF